MDAQILHEPDVLALLGVGKATLWRWRKAGNFPAPLQLGPNRIAWRRDEVERWLATRPRAVGGNAAA